jgi:hypothetical protein
MTCSYKISAAALMAAMLAGPMSVSTPASASGHHGYGVTLQHRGNIAAHSPARHWRQYWGLDNPERCGFWGWGDCRVSGPAPAYATSAGYCGPAARGAASVTGLGYYGTDYTTDPLSNYYSFGARC